MINHSNNFYAGLEFAVETLKSFILAMALIDNRLNVEKAVSLSRLELEFQVGVLKKLLYYVHITDIYTTLNSKAAGSVGDHYKVMGNCPPTPPLSQH